MIPLLFILLLFSPLLGGCLDANEIETLAIVSGLTIDKGSEKNFHVTAELVGTGSGKENESKPVIVSSEGDTIYDCIKSMKSPDGKRLYLSHCKICVLSADATPNGIRSLVDWSSRDPESRLTMSLLFSEGRAADLFSAPPKSGNTAVSYTHLSAHQFFLVRHK